MDLDFKDFSLTKKKVAKAAPAPVNEELEIKKRHVRNQINRALNQYFGILVILLVVGFFAASFFFVLKPRYVKILDSINTTTFEKNQLFPRYKELDSYRNIAKAFQNINPEDVSRVKDMIPDEYIKEDLFTELVYIIADEGFTVDSLDVVKDTESKTAPKATTPATTPRRTQDEKVATTTPTTTPAFIVGANLPSGVGKMKVHLEVSNVDYPGLKVLLGVLENSLRILDISKVDFSPANNSVAFDLITYYSKK